MAETYNLKPHKGPERALEVVRVMRARNGTVRFCLNSGSHVTALATGEYACLHRKCIDAAQANKCKHVEFVKSIDTEGFEEQAVAAADPYLNEYKFPVPGKVRGIHQSVAPEAVPNKPDAA